ncbi:tRNA lysidine(34) synthetase TilS [bacterium]|nr:tRNA lysidine(34) synthetase TilS [bacterium]
MVKKIQSFSGRYGLWEEGSRIIVGVSGGPDSACLLDILVKLAPKYNFKLYIAHVNYGLRGKDSDRDEEFVRELAGKYELGVSVLSIAKNKIYENAKVFQIPPNPPFPKGENLENWLREIRYDFFEKIRKRKKYNLIAVAHNRDDQAETVLMRVLRGAGLQGLAVMRPKTPHPSPLPKGEGENIIIRPLLNTSRKEILEYLKENKLKYQTDITNKDIKISRNKIRHRLIPYLEKNYNPNIKKTLANMSLIVADDYDCLSANGKRMIKQINATKTDKIIFSAGKFQKLHPAMQRQVLRQMIFQIRADLTDIETCHIEEIIKIIESKKSKIQRIEFKGLKIEKKGDKVSVVKM